MRKPTSKKDRAASARNVVELRATLGLSREDFAARLKVSVITVRAWERGDRVPTGLPAGRMEGLRP